MRLRRRAVLAGAAAPFLTPARGRTVRLRAADDDDRWNACIAWAGERMLMLHDVRVRHVRLPDAAADLASVPAARSAVAWRTQQIVFVYHPACGRVPPVRLSDLAAWAAAHPGRLAPAGSLAAARARFAAGACDLYLASNPGEAACGIARGLLLPGTRAVAPPDAPVRFEALAISPDGDRLAARLLARFLRSPEAQAHFADQRHCGSPSPQQMQAGIFAHT